jgi:hypothetical protein
LKRYGWLGTPCITVAKMSTMTREKPDKSKTDSRFYNFSLKVLIYNNLSIAKAGTFIQKSVLRKSSFIS